MMESILIGVVVIVLGLMALNLALTGLAMLVRLAITILKVAAVGGFLWFVLQALWYILQPFM